MALLSMASSSASVRPRVDTGSLTPHKTQPATRLRFRFCMRHSTHPTRPCATQLYIVYYFFNFYFIYKVRIHAHARQRKIKESCGLRFWRTTQKLIKAQLATLQPATLQPSETDVWEGSPRSTTEFHRGLFLFSVIQNGTK